MKKSVDYKSIELACKPNKFVANTPIHFLDWILTVWSTDWFGAKPNLRPDPTTSRLWSGNELTLETRPSFRALPHAKLPIRSQSMLSSWCVPFLYYCYCLTTTEYFIVGVVNALVSLIQMWNKIWVKFHQVFYTVVVNVLRFKLNLINL